MPFCDRGRCRTRSTQGRSTGSLTTATTPGHRADTTREPEAVTLELVAVVSSRGYGPFGVAISESGGHRADPIGHVLLTLLRRSRPDTRASSRLHTKRKIGASRRGLENQDERSFVVKAARELEDLFSQHLGLVQIFRCLTHGLACQ